jgi:hypothetical protein
VDEGDCGITLFLSFPRPETAAWFQEALIAEGISVGPSSGCSNLLDSEPIRSCRMVNDRLPPFGIGYAGERVSYDSASLCVETRRILARQVAIGIGPLYSEEDADDIIAAIGKVAAALDAGDGPG